MSVRKATKRRASVRQVTMIGNRTLSAEEATAVRLELSRTFRQRHEQSLLSRRLARIERLPVQRRSVERAMLAVEAQFVKAVWILQRCEGGTMPVSYGSTNGVTYSHDAVDRYGQAVANGGWELPSARPALPSSKEISRAEEAQTWVRFLEPMQARVLTIGAISKRGDAGRKVNWMRVRGRLPEMESYTVRHLQGIYTAALRGIVTAMTERGLAS